MAQKKTAQAAKPMPKTAVFKVLAEKAGLEASQVASVFDALEGLIKQELGRFVRDFPRHELVEWALPYLGDSKLRLKQPAAARDVFKMAVERFAAPIFRQQPVGQ